MRESKLRRITELVARILAWDKVDANQIVDDINALETLLLEENFSPSDFGIETIPSAYIPKSLKQSGIVLAVDKQKQCITGEIPPYEVKPVEEVKHDIKLMKLLEDE